MSKIILYPFQENCKREVYQSWNSHKNVMLVLPTGAGKTVVAADILREHHGPAIAIAHRQEIVSQISLALARNQLRHRIIGPAAVIRGCVARNLSDLNRNYVDQNSKLMVAGVDTLIRIQPAPWMKQVGLVFQDENHHQLKKNKWGKAFAMFPNAKLLGVTATPIRADGQGLGLHADGFIQKMIVGPGMRSLINSGWLTDYRIFCPPSDIDLSGINLGVDGDYNYAKLSTAVHKSRITGDVVAQYKKIAGGKRGLTFAVDVKSAVEIAQAYRDAGVPAEVVSAKTPDGMRAALLRKLARGDVLQLVNVDLFGEGMDCPAVEVVSMARPTASYGLYCQQFGRALRILEGKEYAVIIDHVGNVGRHGLPDKPRTWSLDRRDRATKNNAPEIPIRVCPQCLGAYEAIYKACPYCGYEIVPKGRSTPEMVDGDLFELSPYALAALRANVDKPLLIPYSATPAITGHLKKIWHEKNQAQSILREAMAVWAGTITQATDWESISLMQKIFYFKFGIDVLSAQALNATDAKELYERINSTGKS